LRLFSFGGYGLALAALALVVFGDIECPPHLELYKGNILRTNGLFSYVKVHYLELSISLLRSARFCDERSLPDKREKIIHSN